MKEVCLSPDDVYNEIIRPCRKGQYIYVICDSENLAKKLKRLLKAHLSDYRGVFTWKGIVVISLTEAYYSNTYFDEIIKIIAEKKCSKIKSLNK